MSASSSASKKGLYGLDNFYYRRSLGSSTSVLSCLYGLDNFYYRRFNPDGVDAVKVYTDLIISTIVDPINLC